MSKIEHIHARQILDSRGNPTVEAEVSLVDGSVGRASVPSGASTGSREVHELRDGGTAYAGKGVLQAVENARTAIADTIKGIDASDQAKVDKELIEIDGTKDKSRLGANAILAVSLATAKAQAQSEGLPFFKYIATLSRLERTPLLPVPMCNLINGGRHATQSADIQEFMVLPIGAGSFTKAIQMSAEIFHTLRDMLHERGYATTVGDEGGYAPSLTNGSEEALSFLVEAIEKAGYVPGQDVTCGIDVAASELFDKGVYTFMQEGKTRDTEAMIEYLASLTESFPLVSIEDGLHEDDWVGWKKMAERFDGSIQLVGDDFLVTNPEYLQKAIEEKSANTILIKPNQIGTLTETIEAVDMAHEAAWDAVVSHRSGETEDITIAHLAVGLSTGLIKTGSLSRGERTAKYNELLRIEEQLGDQAEYGFLED